MTKHIKCIICCLLIVVLLCGCASRAPYVVDEIPFDWKEIENNPHEREYIKEYEELNICYGPVETPEEAAKVAQDYWLTLFSRSDIFAQRPYVVSYDEINRVWAVSGVNRWLGFLNKIVGGISYGEAYIWISADDGRILLCYHTV